MKKNETPPSVRFDRAIRSTGVIPSYRYSIVRVDGERAGVIKYLTHYDGRAARYVYVDDQYVGRLMERADLGDAPPVTALARLRDRVKAYVSPAYYHESAR